MTTVSSQVAPSDATAPAGNGRFELERHGFDFIPESGRTMTLTETGFFWLGANANLFFVTVGAIALGLGLTVWQALLAVLVGNLLFGYVAWGAVAGPRAGLPTLTLSRAAFGVQGNRFHGFLAWLTSVAFEAINTTLAVFAVVALFDQIGWDGSGAAGKVIALVAVLCVSAGGAYLGHATMVWIQRVFAYALIVVLLAVFAYTVGGVDWNAGADTGLSFGATLALMCVAVGIVASGPLSYLFNTADFVRYLPSATASRKIVRGVFAAAFSMALFLSVMGVLLASRGDMSDPVAGVEPFVPGWLFVLYILAAIGGLVANNVLTFYASGLILQSIGLPLRRYQATFADVAVSTLLILYVLFVRDFTTSLNDFLALMNVWIGPFGAVWIVDGALRRWRYDPVEIHAVKQAGSRYWYWKGISVTALAAWASGAVVGALTLNAPVFQGPLSKALGDADLNWLLGFVVAACVYVALEGGRLRRERQDVPREHIVAASRLGETGTLDAESHGDPGSA